MIGIDTNVLIRYVTRDDAEQEQLARQLFVTHRVFVPTTVLLEVEWVLRCTYRYPAERIADVLAMITETSGITVENSERARLAIAALREGLDFVDALHLSACGELERFATFDRPLFRRARRIFAAPEVVSP